MIECREWPRVCQPPRFERFESTAKRGARTLTWPCMSLSHPPNHFRQYLGGSVFGVGLSLEPPNSSLIDAVLGGSAA